MDSDAVKKPKTGCTLKISFIGSGAVNFGGAEGTGIYLP